MALTKARRQQLILGRCGIAVTWIAAAVLEVVLLGERALVAVTATTIFAALVGAQLTRKVTTPHVRASITVGDLRTQIHQAPSTTGRLSSVRQRAVSGPLSGPVR